MKHLTKLLVCSIPQDCGGQLELNADHSFANLTADGHQMLACIRQNNKSSSDLEKCKSTRIGSVEIQSDVRTTHGAMWYAFRLHHEANPVIMIRTSSMIIMESCNAFFFDVQRDEACQRFFIMRLSSRATCTLSSHKPYCWGNMSLDWKDMSACITFD